MKKITVDIVANGLVSQGYIEKGGSDVFRILVDPKDGQHIKIYYDDYNTQSNIIVRESIEAHFQCG